MNYQISIPAPKRKGIFWRSKIPFEIKRYVQETTGTDTEISTVCFDNRPIIEGHSERHGQNLKRESELSPQRQVKRFAHEHAKNVETLEIGEKSSPTCAVIFPLPQ